MQSSAAPFFSSPAPPSGSTRHTAFEEGMPSRATESSPILPGETVLVLSGHAKMGRQISTLIAMMFLLGFHGALIAIAVLNWRLPCEAPLAAFLLCAGCLGVAGAVIYLWLELKRNRDEALLLPSESLPPTQQTHKVLVVLIIGATLCVALAGAIGYAHAPSCALSSPIVYHWTLAVLLLYAAFVGLVLLVPLLSAALPFLAVGLTVIIDHLVGVASWMSEAGKRGAFGAASTLQRWLSVGAGGAEPPQQPTIANPQSTFALYVNTAALVWLYGYMLIEVVCSWRLACDVPLTTFVLGASGLGLSMALSDFVTDVFKNPMPPLTKLEHTRAKDDRRRRFAGYGWLLALILVWGALGLYWLNESVTCAASSPGIFRLALLLSAVYLLVVFVLGVVLLALAVDFCLSGKLRMVVIFEQ